MVVSNAAVNPSVDAILASKEAVLDKLWEINVKAAILLLQVSCIDNAVFSCKSFTWAVFAVLCP